MIDIKMIAMILLFSNDGIPQDLVSPNKPEIREACRKIAIEEEWLDEREEVYDINDGWKMYKIFQNEDNFSDDLIMMQKRRQDLESCPKLSDVYLFYMPIFYIQECKSFNRKHLDWLESAWLLNTDRRARFRDAIEETKSLYNIYDTLETAKSDNYNVNERRMALKKLKNLIGVKAYYGAAAFPPCVPFWRFTEIE